MIAVMSRNLICYHLFLIWEPASISFNYVSALMSLCSLGINGSYIAGCGMTNYRFRFHKEDHFDEKKKDNFQRILHGSLVRKVRSSDVMDTNNPNQFRRHNHRISKFLSEM